MPDVMEAGASAEAGVIRDLWLKHREFLHRSHAIGSGHVIREELAEVWEECSQPDWDGYGALPVSDAAFEHACRFLLALPYSAKAPSVGALPDGSVSFDWQRARRHSLSVAIDGMGMLHYAALLGPERARGRAPFVDSIPATILQLIAQTSPC